MTDTILCIDIGTTSLKAALMSDKRETPFVSRQHFGAQSASEWILALANALTELQFRNPDYAIEAVCISGNGPTIVSEDGTMLLHNDAAQFPEPRELPPTQSLFIPRIELFRSLFPESWQTSASVFGAPEFLIFELTGSRLTILPEERFRTAYWNAEELRTRGFSDAEIQKMPEFRPVGAFAGTISARAAVQTGLLEGTLVFCGAPDFVAALIGTGTIFPGTACDRAGSTEGLNLCTDRPVFAAGLRTLPSVIPGRWNLSKLIERPSESKAEGFAAALRDLRKAAADAGIRFPDNITTTGGQALNKTLVAEKEKAGNIQITIPYCTDAELIGDLILARTGLGDFDDIEDGVFCMLGVP